MLKEGIIGIPESYGGGVAHYWAKVYDEGSDYGIDDGRISKLLIEIDGIKVVNYDRGWDIKPDEDDIRTMLAYQICLLSYN